MMKLGKILRKSYEVSKIGPQVHSCKWLSLRSYGKPHACWLLANTYSSSVDCCVVSSQELL